MPNVRIWKRVSKDIVLRDYFSLIPPPASYDETREEWDDGPLYTLPEGCRVANNQHGEPTIFNLQDRAVDIEVHSSGRPQLQINRLYRPVLKRID